MKNIITSLAIAIIALLGFAQKASARGYESRVYISSYRSCGTPVYTERYLIGYDPCGRPIWGTRVVRAPYRPVVRPVYVAPCPPPRYVGPRHYSGPNRGTSFSLSGSWSR